MSPPNTKAVGWQAPQRFTTWMTSAGLGCLCGGLSPAAWRDRHKWGRPNGLGPGVRPKPRYPCFAPSRLGLSGRHHLLFKIQLLQFVSVAKQKTADAQRVSSTLFKTSTIHDTTVFRQIHVHQPIPLLGEAPAAQVKEVLLSRVPR